MEALKMLSIREKRDRPEGFVGLFGVLMEDIITMHCSIFRAGSWEKSIRADKLWIFDIICRISEPLRCRFEVSLNNPILQHREPWSWFSDSLCYLGGALTLAKHYLLHYIVIKLAPEGEETAAIEVDSCEIKSLYSVCAVCLQLYMAKSASLGCTVIDTDINPCFSAPIYSCNIFISCVLCM